MNLNKKIRRLKDRIRLNRRTFLIYSVLRALGLVAMVRCAVMRQYEDVALCALSLFLFLLPSYFEDRMSLTVSPMFETVIYIFIYAAWMLGELHHLYILVPGWDTLLHTINGFLCAAVGFSLFDILNAGSRRIQLSPVYLAVVAFCFSMTVGVLWEFIEFGGDVLFRLDMQKDYVIPYFGSVTLDPTHSQIPVNVSGITKTIIETSGGKTYVIPGGYLDIGIVDTMKDLFVNFLGALTFSIIGYRQVCHRSKLRITEHFAVRPETDEERAVIAKEIDEEEAAYESRRMRRRK